MNRRHSAASGSEPAPIEELDRVRLTRSVVAESGRSLGAGAKGTVVSVYGRGEAFCIEFTSPAQDLATVGPGDIEAIVEETRARLTSSSEDIPR